MNSLRRFALASKRPTEAMHTKVGELQLRCNSKYAPKLKQRHMLVLFVLCIQYDKTPGRCEISFADILSYTHIGEAKTLRGTLGELAEYGVLSWNDGTNGDIGNHYKPTKFELHIDVKSLSKTDWWKGVNEDPIQDDAPATKVAADAASEPVAARMDPAEDAVSDKAKAAITFFSWRLIEKYQVEKAKDELWKVEKRLRDLGGGSLGIVSYVVARILVEKLGDVDSPIGLLLDTIDRIGKQCVKAEKDKKLKPKLVESANALYREFESEYDKNGGEHEQKQG